jgi:hypothetical protein
MKPLSMMDNAQWETLVQDVTDYFDDLTVKRGFQYYKQGRVHQLKETSTRSIEAVVEGTHHYLVQMDLDFFTVSQCDCPVESTCKHMIAVLLHYADLQGRSVHALANAKSMATSNQAPKASAYANSYTKATQINDRKAEHKATLMAETQRISIMSIPEWHRFFELCTASMGINTPNQQYVADAQSTILNVKPPLSPVMEQLFHLHVRLFLLDQLTKTAQNPSYPYGSHMGYFTHLAVSELKEAIQDGFKNGLALTDEPERWDRLTETLNYLRFRMLTASSAHHFSDMYHQLLKSWIAPNFNDTRFFSEELQRLQSAEMELGASLSRPGWMIARCWMHFYLSEDREAWALLKEADDQFHIHSRDFLRFLAELSDAAEWPRMVNWLVELGPMLIRKHYDSLQHYSVYWESAIRQLPGAEPSMWDLLGRMLPYSGEIYEEALLRHEKWQEWVDYQLATVSNPLEYRVNELQPLEKKAPELLLPFYHQAIERHVLEKNRQSYKSAAKLLKRLSKLYKKMNREARWEMFFRAFTSRYSRLRALQEELRKGKLLP